MRNDKFKMINLQAFIDTEKMQYAGKNRIS